MTAPSNLPRCSGPAPGPHPEPICRPAPTWPWVPAKACSSTCTWARPTSFRSGARRATALPLWRSVSPRTRVPAPSAGRNWPRSLAIAGPCSWRLSARPRARCSPSGACCPMNAPVSWKRPWPRSTVPAISRA